jgi:predicted nuclease of predicted toxin-antitoxin system
MRIYLDEDLASGLLSSLLAKAGHDVAAPATCGLLGRSDAVQLAFAIADNRVCLSRNYEDFEELHLLLQQGQGAPPRHHCRSSVKRSNA